MASAVGVALGASLLSTAAFAQVTALGNLDPPDAGVYNEVVASGPLSVEGTFELTKVADTSLSATVSVTRESMYTPGYLDLYEGATLEDTLKLTFTKIGTGTNPSGVYTASFTTVLGPGDYTAEINGTSNTTALGVSGSVLTSPIPESSTWAMMVIGFIGLGYAAFRRKVGNRTVAAI
jgi:hypothetical protein